MAHRGRKSADATLALALACGGTVAAAAKQAGVSERTAYRRLSQPEFRDEIRRMRSEFVERTSSKLTAAGVAAVNALVAMLEESSHAARLGAAKAILELGGKFRESTELLERIERLEARIDEQNKHRESHSPVGTVGRRVAG